MPLDWIAIMEFKPMKFYSEGFLWLPTKISTPEIYPPSGIQFIAAMTSLECSKATV